MVQEGGIGMKRDKRKTESVRPSAYKDALKFKARVERIKKECKPDSILVYREKSSDGGKAKWHINEAIVIKLYDNYILTEDGCIKFDDVIELIDFTQEVPKK